MSGDQVDAVYVTLPQVYFQFSVKLFSDAVSLQFRGDAHFPQLEEALRSVGFPIPCDKACNFAIVRV